MHSASKETGSNEWAPVLGEKRTGARSRLPRFAGVPSYGVGALPVPRVAEKASKRTVLGS